MKPYHYIIVQHYNWSTRKNPSANQSAATQRGFVMEKRSTYTAIPMV